MSARRTISIAAIVAALLVAAAGCSDDDEGPTLSEDDYVEQANAICDEVRAEIEDAVTAIDQTDDAAVQAFVSDTSELYLDQMEALRDLGTPPGESDDLLGAYDLYEARFQQWVDEPERAGAPTEDEDFTAASEAMADYGLTSCAPAAGS